MMRKAGDERELCILAIDGGGIRGLSSLYIIQELMLKVNKRRSDNGLPKVKPCQIFDLIGGTSTGGLIAIMLGRLEMTVDECIIAYEDFCKRVFVNEQFKLSFNPSAGITKGHFDPTKLEQAIKEVIRAEVGETDMKFVVDVRDDQGRIPCKVAVCAIAHGLDPDAACLRSYITANQYERDDTTVVEAVRATFATTPFFEPVFIAGQIYEGDAASVSNPAYQIWEEAKDIWQSDDDALENRIQCFISVGAGISDGRGSYLRIAASHTSTGTSDLVNGFSPPYSLDSPQNEEVWAVVSETLADIRADIRDTSESFRQHHYRLYDRDYMFRFDVSEGLPTVGLDECLKKDKIRRATINYLQAQQAINMRRCVDQMSTRQPNLFERCLPQQISIGGFIDFPNATESIDRDSTVMYGSEASEGYTTATRSHREQFMTHAIEYSSSDRTLPTFHVWSPLQRFRIWVTSMEASVSNLAMPIVVCIIGLALCLLWSLSGSTENSHLKQIDKSLPIFAVLGRTGAGKSSFINTLGGVNIRTAEPAMIGHRLTSCTNKTEFFKVDLPDSLPHRQAYLVDTQGIDDSDVNRNDSQIMNDVFNQLNILHHGDKLLMGLIFMYDISQPRIGGSIINSLNMIEHLCGKDGISKVALVTTRWYEGPDLDIIAAQMQREKDLRETYWKGPLDCGSSIVPYFGTKESAFNILSHLMNQRRLVLPAQSGAACRFFELEPQRDINPDLEKASLPKHETHSTLPRKLLDGCAYFVPILLKCIYILFWKLVMHLATVVWHEKGRGTSKYSGFQLHDYIGPPMATYLAVIFIWPGWLCLGSQCQTVSSGSSAPRLQFLESIPIWCFRLSPLIMYLFDMAIFRPEERSSVEWRRVLPWTIAVIDLFQGVFLWEPRWGRGWWHAVHPVNDTVHGCLLLFPAIIICGLYFTTQGTDSAGDILEPHLKKVDFCFRFVVMFTFWALYYYTPRLGDKDFDPDSAGMIGGLAAFTLSSFISILDWGQEID